MSKFKVGDKVLIEGKINKIKYGLDFLVDVDVDGKNIIIEEDKITSKTYEDGLADAWELARKIVGMTRQAWYEIFKIEDAYLADILDDNTPQQALAKIEAYEVGMQATEEALDIINQVEAEYNNGWIKCKDKLPEKTQRYYLVRYEICVAETVLRFTGKDYFTSDGKWEIEGRESDTKVTYWQPMPKPPKGECYKDDEENNS